MAEQLLKHYAIDIEQKLHEKETPRGHLAVYQTSAFGLLLTLNGRVVMSETDGYFFHEMISHSALFTHGSPQKIAVIGNAIGTLNEVLKHPDVVEVCCINDNSHLEEMAKQYFPRYQQPKDDRVIYITLDSLQWLSHSEIDAYDVIIQTEVNTEMLEDNFKNYFRALRTDGIMIQPCLTSYMNVNELKGILQNIHHAGFMDTQIMTFPQPSYHGGWHTLIMATKRPSFHRIRERDIYNRIFATRYYNYDMHKASLALPEFVKDELGEV